MKVSHLLAIFLLMSAEANAQSTVTFSKLRIEGNTQVSIRHMIDMKMIGDTLLFVSDSKDSYGQQFLRRAVVDSKNNKLSISCDMGKRSDGYYVSDMPYPYIAFDGSIRVVSRDNCEIYTIENDTTFARTKQYLMSENSVVPVNLSQYVKDVFMTAPDKYVFIGREPNGGRQFALTADVSSAKIDSIRQISISPKLQAWMANTGEMAYSSKHSRIAFAYTLHPVIEFFGEDGAVLNTVEVAKPTFRMATLNEADFEDLNPLHFIDITATDDYIYAIYWGQKFAQRKSPNVTSSIYKLDWGGNIINQYTVNANLHNIAVYNPNTLIAWTGAEFILIQL